MKNMDTNDAVPTERWEQSQRGSEGRGGANLYIIHQPFLISNNPFLKAGSAISSFDGPAALQTLPKKLIHTQFYSWVKRGRDLERRSALET